MRRIILYINWDYHNSTNETIGTGCPVGWIMHLIFYRAISLELLMVARIIGVD
jgi:hypothetical protein